MLYVSAVFLFLLLPAILGVYTLVPKDARRYVLLSSGVVFYILANLKSPVAIIILAATALLTHFAGKRIASTKSRGMLAAVVIVDILAFAALRITYEATVGGFVFPLGAAVYLLMSASFCIDAYRGDSEPGSLADTMLYMTFFPVMVAGPVIKYKDFVKCYSEANHNVNRFSDGARLFAVGFIKRIAVASVMSAAYADITGLSGGAVNFAIGILSALLLLMAAFFAITGWTDMGCGLALMLGIQLPRDSGFALAAYTPLGYFKCLLHGYYDWLEDYVIKPLNAFFGERKKLAGAAGVIVIVFCFLLWIKTSAAMLCAAAVIAVIALLIDGTPVGESIRQKKYLRPAGWILTIASTAFFWTAAVSASQYGLFGAFGGLGAPDFRSYYVYISLSGGKYITVIAVALLVLAPMSYGKNALMKRMPKGVRTAYDAFSMVLLIAAFVISLLYFMPQYPQYAARAFDYLVF